MDTSSPQDFAHSHYLKPPVTLPQALVIDEAPEFGDLLLNFFKLAEYNVDMAQSGGAVIERIELNDGDLLMTNLKSRDIGGLSAIHQARQLHSDLPEIVITGDSTESSAIKTADLKVADYLIKPFNISTALTMAAKALGK